MQAVAFRVVPTVVVVVLVAATLLGQDGLLALWRLEEQAVVTRAAWGETERENSRRLLVLQRLQTDPLAVERLVAEELRLAPPGATLYEFGEAPRSAPAIP